MLLPGGIQWDQKVRHEDINVGGKYYWAQNEYEINAKLSYRVTFSCVAMHKLTLKM